MPGILDSSQSIKQQTEAKINKSKGSEVTTSYLIKYVTDCIAKEEKINMS